jgi:type II secretory pathway component PulK
MSDKSEEGVALIAVLWMLTLLSIMAAGLAWETRSDARIARNMVDNATARAAADAGIQRALLDLVGLGKKQFRTDGSVYTWRFANSRVRISVKDEASKVDLNQAPEAILTALFAWVGVDSGKAQSLADAIADFRDPDNLRRPSGAEASDYQDAGLAWGPKNAPFQTVEELQQVLGMTAEIYARVAPAITLYSVPQTLEETPDQPLSEILRRATGLRGVPANAKGLVFLIRAQATGPTGAAFVREAVVQPSPDEKIPRVLSWRQGAPGRYANATAN